MEEMAGIWNTSSRRVKGMRMRYLGGRSLIRTLRRGIGGGWIDIWYWLVEL